LYGVKLLGWFGDFDPTLLELLTFGVLIAATDTVSVLGVLQAKRVDPHLFSLVFSESALNDAAAIALYLERFPRCCKKEPVTGDQSYERQSTSLCTFSLRQLDPLLWGLFSPF
jgi:hypothetical protein